MPRGAFVKCGTVIVVDDEEIDPSSVLRLDACPEEPADTSTRRFTVEFSILPFTTCRGFTSREGYRCIDGVVIAKLPESGKPVAVPIAVVYRGGSVDDLSAALNYVTRILRKLPPVLEGVVSGVRKGNDVVYGSFRLWTVEPYVSLVTWAAYVLKHRCRDVECILASFLRAVPTFSSLTPVMIRPKKTRQNIGERYAFQSDRRYTSSVNPWFSILARQPREIAACYREGAKTFDLSVYLCSFLDYSEKDMLWRHELISMNPEVFEALVKPTSKMVGSDIYISPKDLIVQLTQYGTHLKRIPVPNL